MNMYRSKHWSVTEWDCYGNAQNPYAWDDETGHLCTDNERTANLFKILDMLREWNPNWRVNMTYRGWNSGYRDAYVNARCGGVPDSYHMRGCAADIHIGGQDDTDTALADTVLVAAEAWGLEDKLGIGYYGDWIHIDTRGYTARWRG